MSSKGYQKSSVWKIARSSRKRQKARRKEEFNADQEYLTKNLPYFTAILFYAGVLRDFVRAGFTAARRTLRAQPTIAEADLFSSTFPATFARRCGSGHV